MRKKLLLALLLALSPGFLNAAGPTKKLDVVATFLPMQAHAASVAGDLATVRQLLGKDAGPHEFQFRPSDVKSLAEADLLIINGAGIESWLDAVIEKAGNPRLKVIDTSAGVEFLDSPATGAEAPDESHDHEHDHDHGEGHNPHIWLDPQAAIRQTENIRDAFIAADPANAEGYRANAQSYIAKLRQLDSDFQAAMEKLPGRDLITFHDSYLYLARRYGLNDLGAFESFPEKDPSPRQLAALIDLIRSHQVKVLFSEKGYAPKLLEEIAAQTGAKTAELDTLEIGSGTADSYLERMRANLETLRSAWQP